MRKSSLSEFLAAGLSIELDGDELVISGLSSLPDAEADRIVEQIKTNAGHARNPIFNDEGPHLEYCWM